LILVLLAMMAISALATSLAVLVSTESRVAANYRDGIETLYGAEAAVHRVLPDLAAETDLDAVLSGAVVSSWTDGPPGRRRLPDGTFADLHELTAMVNCGREVCGDADLDETRDERPWGRNNPRWQLYAYGQLPGDSRVYAVVWIADDPSETDEAPLIDGGGDENPGRGRLSITTHGYGPNGTRRIIEATAVMNGQVVEILSWREIR
jgi:hypothetical protein